MEVECGVWGEEHLYRLRQSSPTRTRRCRHWLPDPAGEGGDLEWRGVRHGGAVMAGQRGA